MDFSLEQAKQVLASGDSFSTLAERNAVTLIAIAVAAIVIAEQLTELNKTLHEDLGLIRRVVRER